MTARTAFQGVLDGISREILLLAAHVTEAIPAVTDALLAHDHDGARAVIDHDQVLDVLAVDIEERCYRALATQQPVAADLRSLVAALRMVTEIERAGNLVVNIARTHRSLGPVELPPSVRGDLQEMGELATELFRTCVDAYVERDASLAGRLDDLDDPLDAAHDRYIEAVLCWIEDTGQLHSVAPLVLIGRYYERIGDHAVTIGERVQYLIDGGRPAVGTVVRPR